MNKIKIILLTSACALAITNNSLGSEAGSPEKVSDKNKLLQRNNELLHDNNLLLRTLILQNQTWSVGYISEQDARRITLYKETNIQLKDQSLCLPTK